MATGLATGMATGIYTGIATAMNGKATELLATEKSVFVVDLDDTLVYFDEMGKYDHLKLYYLRPHAKEFVEELRQLTPGNKMVLWSAGIAPYVYDVLFKTPIGPCFDFVLTRDDCETSKRIFKVSKSVNYVKNYMIKSSSNKEFNPKNYKWVLIDDQAVQNGGKGYDELITVPKYRPENKNDKALVKILLQRNLPQIELYYPHFIPPGYFSSSF